MNISFCLGNGPSRLNFDLNLLKTAGPTYGCNNLIETFELDNTVIVDRSLLVDMISQCYNTKTNIYTRKRWKNLVEAENLHFLNSPIKYPIEKWDNEIHWGSGTHAINLAASNGADIIIMLGYDLYSGNVYNNVTVDPNCWIYQIKKCFDLYPNIQFVQIQDDKWENPNIWDNENYSQDSFKGLIDILNTME